MCVWKSIDLFNVNIEMWDILAIVFLEHFHVLFYYFLRSTSSLKQKSMLLCCFFRLQQESFHFPRNSWVSMNCYIEALIYWERLGKKLSLKYTLTIFAIWVFTRRSYSTQERKIYIIVPVKLLRTLWKCQHTY